ncbi:helix-turn-helix domain-containing protein [Acrocarpospora pleiomorpha]|nr:helix-turn-helix transcriptional regulator [Acrocarpospora pleiomorpha]
MQTTKPRQRPLIQNPEAVRRRRLAAGLGQVALGEKVGITHAHVSKIENGKSSAGAGVLFRLAGALNCTVEDLLA